MLLSGMASGQSIRNTFFNDVIVINASDVATDGYDFLIDIPIEPQEEPIVILNNDNRIPLHLFFERKSFLSEQDEIILITPDWEYYEYFSEQGGCVKAKPIRQNKFYHIQRNTDNYDVKIDSIAVRMDEPHKPIELNFKKIEIDEEVELKYYHSNSISKYSSQQKGKLDSLSNQLQANICEGGFKRYKIMAAVPPNKGNTMAIINYYALSALPLEKKLPAMKALNEIFRFKENDHLKDFEFYPRIYLPSIEFLGDVARDYEKKQPCD